MNVFISQYIKTRYSKNPQVLFIRNNKMVKIFNSLAVFGAISVCSGASYNIDYSKIMHAVPSISGPIDSSIFSNHHVAVNKIPSTIERDEVPMIVIDSNAMPIKMLFKTASANLDIKQEHENAPPNTQETNSVDGEIVLKHTVKKPVIQYVYEEILPSRFLTQKIEPVKEYVKTIVTKNDASTNDNENGADNGNGNDNGDGEEDSDISKGEGNGYNYDHAEKMKY